MSSSIFNFDVFRRSSGLPLREKLWSACVLLAMATTLHLSLLALPGRTRDNHMSMGARAVGPQTQVLAVGSSHVYRGIDPDAISVEHMNLAGDAFDYICMEGVLASALDRAPNLQAVIIEIDPLVYHLDTINYYWGDYRILYDLQCDLSALNIGMKRKLSIWWGRVMYDSYIAPTVAKHKLTPRALHHRANQETAYDRPGFLPRFGVVDETNDGRERIRRQLRDIGPPSPQRMAANHNALVRMVQRVLDRDIQVVLMRMPTHETYRENRPDEWLEAYNQQLTDLQNRYADKGVVFWNLEGDGRLTNEDFFDGDHLNAEGAVKFARILDQMIQPLVRRTADAQSTKSSSP